MVGGFSNKSGGAGSAVFSAGLGKRGRLAAWVVAFAGAVRKLQQSSVTRVAGRAVFLIILVLTQFLLYPLVL